MDPARVPQGIRTSLLRKSLLYAAAIAYLIFRHKSSTACDQNNESDGSFHRNSIIKPDFNRSDQSHGDLGVVRRNETGIKKSVAILSYNDARVGHEYLSNSTLNNMVRCNHQQYARRHGYAYISPEKSSAKWNAARFVLNGLRYKTFSILSHFDEYEVLVWVDHDAIFYNLEISVDHWLENKMRHDADMLMAADIPGYKFNAGVQIIKTTAIATISFVVD